MTATKIVISGIGAIGGFYGGLLAALAESLTSVEVYFYMRPGEHLERVQATGLHITTPTLDVVGHPTLATSDVTQLPKADFLILATKSYDAIDNISQLRSIITSETIVIPMHNGVDIPPLIQQALPDCKLVPSVCYIVSRRSVGEIRVMSDNNILKIGTDSSLVHAVDAKLRERAEWIYLLLKASGVKVAYFDEVAPMLREKYLTISPSAAATAYYNANIGMVQTEYEVEFRALIRELTELYRAEGWEWSEDLADKGFDLIMRMPREGTTSMHSDLLAGNRSEIESLVGYVIREAERLGVPVPLYRKMYEGVLAQY